MNRLLGYGEQEGQRFRRKFGIDAVQRTAAWICFVVVVVVVVVL